MTIGADIMNTNMTLEEGLRRELEAYREILAFAEKQAAAVSEKNTAKLLEILREKQKRIDTISRVETAISDAKQQWESDRSAFSEDRKKEIECIFGDIKKVLGDIIANEDKTKQDVEQQKEAVSQNLKGRSNLKKIKQAYGGAGPNKHILNGFK